MIKNVFVLEQSLVESVKWEGNSQKYDQALYNLGAQFGSGEFLVKNFKSLHLSALDCAEDYETKNNECVVYTYEGNWVGKVFPQEWSPEKGYVEVSIAKPEFVWIKNQNLDRLMTFDDDPFGVYEPEFWDAKYKLVWYIDPKFNPTEDKVWAISCTPLGVKVEGEKDMGYLTPSVKVEINDSLPDLGIDIEDYYPPYYYLHNECVWFLDSQYVKEPTWVYKFKPTYKKSDTYINCGEISPNLVVKCNPKLGELNYELDYVISLDEFDSEHVWLLDRKHLKEHEEDIWAFKISVGGKKKKSKTVGYISPIPMIEQNSKFGNVEFHVDYEVYYQDFKSKIIWNLDKKHFEDHNSDEWCLAVSYVENPKNEKVVGYISPRHYYEYNPSLPLMEFVINYDIPWYDFEQVHKWMLDPGYSPIEENVWAVKVFLTQEPQGEKELGTITPIIKDQLDVIFISYQELNAEENWQRVLEKAPWAKRVDGVKGIFEAHKQAALLAETDMFYVVDGDAWLVDDWKFDYKPNIFDRDCAYVWHSQNPINDLVYGYGGVKLFSKEMMINAKAMNQLDMTTSVMSKLKVMKRISNETRFNVNESTTWRSAFRESVKLSYLVHQNPKNREAAKRLNTWLKIAKGDYFKYAILGTKDGIDFFKKNSDNHELLLKINDMDWLFNLFEEMYKC